MSKPLRGNISVGMKCQWSRSSPSKVNAACCFCSAVRLFSSRVAASAIADEERPAAIVEPTTQAVTISATRHRRDVNEVDMRRILA